MSLPLHSDFLGHYVIIQIQYNTITMKHVQYHTIPYHTIPYHKANVVIYNILYCYSIIYYIITITFSTGTSHSHLSSSGPDPRQDLFLSRGQAPRNRGTPQKVRPWKALRPISLLRLCLLKLVDPNLAGNSP